jgi:hypothetical protein
MRARNRSDPGVHKGLLILISDLEMHENEIRESISLLRSKATNS